MQRETLQFMMKVLATIQSTEFLDPLPHSAARKIAEACSDAELVILDREFDGAEILGECDFCEALLFVEDEGIHSGDDGGPCCAACAKAEMEAQANTYREAIGIMLEEEFKPDPPEEAPPAPTATIARMDAERE